MAQQNTIGRAHTTFCEKNNVLSVVYHQTEILNFNRETRQLILNTGGHFTATTKTRMNQTSNQFDLGFEVYQKNYHWYVSANGQDHKFLDDDITITL